MSSSATEVPSQTWPQIGIELLEQVSSRVNPRSQTGVVRRGDTKELLHFKRFEDLDQLYCEANALRWAREATLGRADVTVANVVGICPEQCLMLTEYYSQYESLFNYLWNSTSLLAFGRRFRSLTPTEITEQLVRWLKALHGTESPANGYVPGSLPCLKMIRAKLDALETRFSGMVSSATLKRLRGFADRFESEVALEQNVGTCRIHGDFVMSNVMIGPAGQLVVLDLADSRFGWPAEDVVQLWHQFWALGQVSRRRLREFRPCLELIEVGFGLREPGFSAKQFVLLRHLNAITSLLIFKIHANQLGWGGFVAARKQAMASLQWLESGNWGA